MRRKTFFDEVLTMKLDDPLLDKIPKRFSVLNRVLRPVLERSCMKEMELADDITRQKLLLQDKGVLITARRVLCMIYANLSTDTNMMDVVGYHS